MAEQPRLFYESSTCRTGDVQVVGTAGLETRRDDYVHFGYSATAELDQRGL